MIKSCDQAIIKPTEESKKRNNPNVIKTSTLFFLTVLKRAKTPYAINAEPSIEKTALIILILPLSMIWFAKKVKICSPSSGLLFLAN